MGCYSPARVLRYPSSVLRSAPALVFVVAMALALPWLGVYAAARDAGELGAAAQALGVPHPTGFPLDMLLLRFAALIPLGSIALRQALAVACISALSLGLLAACVLALSRRAGFDPLASELGAYLAAAGLAGWATFRGTALTVEVYSSALLLVLLALWLELREGGGLGRASPPPPARALAWLALISGLSLGAHIGARLGLAPLVLVALGSRAGASRARRLAIFAAFGLMGALIVSYLPLRSAADPPLDWGDPETPLRLWEHLTASRIRAAYEGEILSADAGARAGIELLGQLLELAALLPLGMLGWLALRRGPGRRFGLLASLLFGLDLAYARWINPMGVADRQVGHLAAAMLALLAGCGLAASLHHVRTRWGPSIARPLGLGAALLAIVLLIGPGAPPHGEAAGELFGAGGSLLDLPPRAILLCRSDDLCAGGLFAIHAEGARPDLSVAPAQHLWEPTVRAPLRAASGALEAVGSSRPAGQRERAELAAALERALLLESARPVLLEVEGDGSLGLAAPRSPPYWAPRAQAGSPAPALEGLERRYRTRREEAARDPRVNAGWARAYGEVGRQALAAAELGVAVAAFRRALVIAPERSVGWSNLGVALARAGDLEGAIEASASAVRIAPSRAIGWLNLARFLAASGRLEQARATLQRARGAGIDDPRLEAFESSLRSARPAPGLP